MHLKSIARSLLATSAIALVAACGSTDSAGSGPVEVRLGYFPNVTHATALVGVARGTYREELGSLGGLTTETFNAGPAAVEALFSGSIDMTYVGPNPAVNAYVQSHGSAVRVIAGATSGGASLVVRKGISVPADLRGRRLASPQLGGTQDVALRYWLSQQGLRSTTSGDGDVAIVPQENAQTLRTFQSGAIDGAWVPEPWASRLVQEGGGKVLVDERSLWPNGRFVTTLLLVRKGFLDAHPAQVKAILRAQVRTNQFINSNPQEAQRIANEQLRKLTGKPLRAATITSAWDHEQLTNDPLASTLREDIQHAHGVGLLKSTDVAHLVDLGILNAVLRDAGEPPVTS